MDCFDARPPAELDRELRANDARVPGRTQGRTTAHTETWVACRFLATIAGTDLLQFPVRVEPGDRPDLLLSGSAEQIGIELTEAISTDQAKVDVMVEREGGPDFRPIPRYRVFDPARSQSEIRALARGESQVLPRMGDSVERDWVEAMLHIVARKAAVFFRREGKRKRWLCAARFARPHSVGRIPTTVQYRRYSGLKYRGRSRAVRLLGRLRSKVKRDAFVGRVF